ncbi:uncharacterized protein K444DRAFT_636663 [Hyaloscypha bicolor E]|uniref:Uncharacterized protein n=1 Tax=Hyaloscypha bicolor E TaxID=1095630 RepID=A0A2J6SKS1_9HELO|nr:uncharacterized protein K444DRAFT_636663 [Hyaloscypha bicolor E]PMD51355.1 hypothetical protein K444DRAFT_636663 [Hyaloscypha bicolor E]
MEKPDHKTTRQVIFEEKEFLQVAFIVGVAHGRGMLKEPIITRWKTFLKYYVPEIYKIDRFTSSQYKLVFDLIKDIAEFAKKYKEAAPEHILEAEKAAPKERWKAPTGLEKWIDKTWDFEIRW